MGKNLRIPIFLLFVIGGVLIYYSGETYPYYAGLGLLVWIIAIIMGYYNLRDNIDKEVHKELFHITYNIAPVLFVLGPILFSLMLFVGITENRIDVPIVGFIFAVVMILLGVWARRRMKQELT